MSSSAKRTSAPTSASLETSPAQEARAAAGGDDVARHALRRSSALTSLTTTAAPSCAKRLAMPSPKPEPPPVTMATLSRSLIAGHGSGSRLATGLVDPPGR